MLDDNTAPDPYEPVKTARHYCSHPTVHPMMTVQAVADLQTIAEKAVSEELGNTYAAVPNSTAIVNAATAIQMDTTNHLVGFLFNEESECPFAVIGDIDGGPTFLVWDFDMSDTDFEHGELHFRKRIGTVEYAWVMLQALTGSSDPGEALGAVLEAMLDSSMLDVEPDEDI